jgi:hypothetical protein
LTKPNTDTKGNDMKQEHIAEIGSWDSGGGMALDLITLKDGRVLVISGDAVVLYENMDAVEQGEAAERPTIYL